ncbi:MAG: universal stress protein [Candidatus Hadarchaeales archaeon]
MYRRMVLCVTDATPEEVVNVAAKLCSRETKVIVLNVVRVLSELVKKDAAERFAWIIDALNREGIDAGLELVEATEVGGAIVSFAKKNDCDIIVTGTIPKKGILGAISENVTDYILKNAPCTVVVVKRAEEGK